jgi:hypothetical protein
MTDDAVLLWGNMIMSLSFDQRTIIENIMTLYNDSKPFTMDATYSTGRFWMGLPGPLFKFDIMPQTSDTIQADVRRLPLGNNSIQSAMFDPPFIAGTTNLGKPGRMKTRFGCHRTAKQMFVFLHEAMAELCRVLIPKGLLVVKCQDTVSDGYQHLTHVRIVNMAEELGFYADDLFVLGNNQVIGPSRKGKQYHARKNHSYFLVFSKSRSKVRRRRPIT